MAKMKVMKKVAEGKEFFYIDVGDERHGKPSFRLWISSKLVKHDEKGIEYIEFPVQNAKIIKTEKGTHVLKPSNEFTVYYVFVQCGYRGKSKINVLEPSDAEIFKFLVYRSQTGSLGISEGLLANVRKGQKLKVQWERTGRTYGEPTKGVTIINEDGSEETLELIDKDQLTELKEMLD
ncbi:MAG: hypothetical protein N3A69_05695 [Leptospiraceae bacterium]|nr:hypothetical protein [Leptospiraceae bacterium]